MNADGPGLALSWTAWGVLFGLGLTACVGWSVARFVRWLVPPKPGDSAAGNERLVPLLILLPASGLLLWLFGPSAPPVLPPPREESLARFSPRQLSEHVTARAADAVAAAGQKKLAARAPAGRGAATPVIDPSLRPGTLVLEPVESRNPSVDRAAALQDALEVARVKLAEALAGLGVPPGRVPSVAQIERDYLRPTMIQERSPTEDDLREFAARGLDTDRRWVRVTLAVGPEQLRDLRAEGRAVGGAAGVATLMAALGVLWGFLRLDAWSKGYLTTALGVGAALATFGFVAVAVYLMRHGHAVVAPG